MIDQLTRKKMENLIYQVFQALDPTGSNKAKYKAIFGNMTDKQFDAFFKKFFESDEYLILETVEYEKTLKTEYVDEAAKILGVSFFEYVAMPFYNNNTEAPVITKHKVPVGYLHIKRPQQLLSKKNSTSTQTGKRSALTNQVTGADKNAGESDQENIALLTIGANKALQELMGPRADDKVMHLEMLEAINRDGYVELDKLTNDVRNKTTLNTVDTFLICMGLKSDLVTKNLLLKRTLDEN